MSRVIIKPETIEVKIIYWPIVNNRVAMPVSCFFKKLGETVLLPENEDNSFHDEYKDFFAKLEPFSFNNFEKLIQSFGGVQHKETTKPPEKPYTPPQISSNDNIEYDPFAGLSKVAYTEPQCTENSEASEEVCICPFCGWENTVGIGLCGKCGSSLEMPDTQMCSDDESETYLIPYIRREKTGEIYTINSESFVLGADPDCDAVISSNDYISRKHIMIKYENGNFTLTDIGSSNGTYINDNRLDVNTAYIIEPDTQMRLADELFTFYIDTSI